MDFYIVTGLSGAGKSHVIRSFEDLGFYCVDNLPPSLLPKFMEIASQVENQLHQVAMGIDARGGEFLDDLYDIIDNLKSKGFKVEIIFLDCADKVLLKRYSETRRKHPLAEEGMVIDGIKKEREILSKLKRRADYIIDTSFMQTKNLNEKIRKIAYGDKTVNKMSINIVSFGFKHGIPLESDLVFDVRFIDNPYYNESLKLLTGLDKKVRDYVLGFNQTSEFMDKLVDMLDFLIPQYISEGKNYLTVAIGCTGGKHRSVTIAIELERILKEKGNNTYLIHKDIDKKGK